MDFSFANQLKLKMAIKKNLMKKYKKNKKILNNKINNCKMNKKINQRFKIKKLKKKNH